MHVHPTLAQHIVADVTGAVTFLLVLCLRLYLLWRASSLRPWQKWLGSLIDGAGHLLYRIVEALLIAVLVGIFTQIGVVDSVLTCIRRACEA